ncbi:MAG: heavy metal-associated domain-containing protein [Planctomycetota bacterium]|nr:heavy metal-associated domain-containing protein [Planctomycetota bacterium]
MISFKHIFNSRCNTLLYSGVVIFSSIASTGCDKMCCQDAASDVVKSSVPMSGNSTTLFLDIQGMHCNGCAKAIDAEARSVDGVSDAQVSLEKHSATIQIATPELAAKVESAIRSLGYTVTVVPAPN